MPTSESILPAMLDQAVFRVLLAAISRPGEIEHLPEACMDGPVAMIQSVSRTLLDHEICFALAGKSHPLFSAADIVRWTHARNTAAAKADFLIVTGDGGHVAISELKRGTPEKPDQGGTVLYLLSDPIGAPAKTAAFSICGPGVPPPGTRPFPSLALGENDLDAIEKACAEFPMGIDCFFLDAHGAVLGLPRSMAIRRTN